VAGHLAVVPVAAIDAPTTRALTYAASLSSRVIAIHVRTDRAAHHTGRADLEGRWAAEARHGEVPLVVVEPAGRGAWWRVVWRTAVALQRAERAPRLTIVVPAPLAAGSPSAMALRLAALTRPGISVARTPRDDVR
jgi:hypothetical protein